MEVRVSKVTKLIAALVPVALVAAVTVTANFNNAARAATFEGRIAKRDGASLYSKYCTRCHGADGKGKTAKGKQTHAGDLTKSRISTSEGVKLIARGKELMPGFKDNMTDAEMQVLMNYVKRFRN